MRVFLILWMVSHSLSAGNTGTIRGVVSDKETGDRLPGVNIIVEGTSIGAATNADGEYILRAVPAGTYTISTSMIGYGKVTMKKFRVFADSTMALHFDLVAQDLGGEEVVVVAERPLIEKDRTSSMFVYRPDDYKSSSGGRTKSQGDASVSVRGGRLNEVGVVIDGFVQDELTSSFNTEEYDRIYENEFKSAFHHPLSTFSIDVDAASYTNTRRYLMNGSLPPKDAVRIEELINYFTYDYAGPTDEHPFAVHPELAECPWNPDHHLLRIGLQGRRVDPSAMPPGNLVFLIDVSGSMDQPNKLPLVVSAFRLLVTQLRAMDRVSIVVYAGAAGLALKPTAGDRKKEILDVLDRLSAGGSTAGGAGIQLAYRVAEENFIANGNNRVILATDGDFNIGVSSTSELVRMIEEKRDRGIFLSALGFGMGNYKDGRLEQLADKGNGNYAYIDHLAEARRVFVNQMSGTLLTIAKDVKLQIEFNPARVKAYRLIGYENRLLAAEDFHNDKKDAGELGAGHSVTALYEIVPAGAAVDLPVIDSLKYQTHRLTSASADWLTLKLRYKMPQDTTSRLMASVFDRPLSTRMSEEMALASAVAEWGMILRDSEFQGKASLKNLLSRARKSMSFDPDGYRSEFVRLVEITKDLKNANP